MQQLTIEHKNVKKDRREGKGHVLAISRRIYRLQRTDSFYVESESSDNNYYLVKFKRNALESSWYCSCKDNSIRGLKCKHLFAIEFAIKWGTIKDVDQVQSSTVAATTTGTNVKQDPAITTIKPVVVASQKSYEDDDYTF